MGRVDGIFVVAATMLVLVSAVVGRDVGFFDVDFTYLALIRDDAGSLVEFLDRRLEVFKGSRDLLLAPAFAVFHVAFGVEHLPYVVALVALHIAASWWVGNVAEVLGLSSASVRAARLTALLVFPAASAFWWFSIMTYTVFQLLELILLWWWLSDSDEKGGSAWIGLMTVLHVCALAVLEAGLLLVPLLLTVSSDAKSKRHTAFLAINVPVAIVAFAYKAILLLRGLDQEPGVSLAGGTLVGNAGAYAIDAAWWLLGALALVAVAGRRSDVVPRLKRFARSRVVYRVVPAVFVWNAAAFAFTAYRNAYYNKAVFVALALLVAAAYDSIEQPKALRRHAWLLAGIAVIGGTMAFFRFKNDEVGELSRFVRRATQTVEEAAPAGSAGAPRRLHLRAGASDRERRHLEELRRSSAEGAAFRVMLPRVVEVTFASVGGGAAPPGAECFETTGGRGLVRCSGGLAASLARDTALQGMASTLTQLTAPGPPTLWASPMVAFSTWRSPP